MHKTDNKLFWVKMVMIYLIFKLVTINSVISLVWLDNNITTDLTIIALMILLLQFVFYGYVALKIRERYFAN